MLHVKLFKRHGLWIVGAVALAGSVAVWYCLFFDNENGAGHLAAKQIQYSFTLQNKTNRVIQDAGLWVYAPLAHTGSQRCEAIQSSHDFIILPSFSSHQILQFSFSAFPPYATKVVSINANVLMAEKPDKSDPNPDRSFLQPERNIECGHPEIKALAEQLTGKNDLTTAKSIFNWVSRQVRYSGYRDDARGALWTLRNKSGDCTEFAHLFTALCRAAGVPSRTVGGYVCKSSQILHAADYHDWAEVLIKNRWRLADPQRNVFDTQYQDYIAMHRHGREGDHVMGEFQRFRINKDGLKVKMN